MAKLPLSLAIGAYDHVRDLADGTVQVEGVDLTVLHLAVEEMFYRFLMHVVEGTGDAQVNDTTIAFDQADTFCAPGFATVRLSNRSSRTPVYLVAADESPLQRKLGIYEQR